MKNTEELEAEIKTLTDRLATAEKALAEMTHRAASLALHLPPETLVGDVRRWRDEEKARAESAESALREQAAQLATAKEQLREAKSALVLGGFRHHDNQLNKAADAAIRAIGDVSDMPRKIYPCSCCKGYGYSHDPAGNPLDNRVICSACEGTGSSERTARRNAEKVCMDALAKRNKAQSDLATATTALADALARVKSYEEAMVPVTVARYLWETSSLRHGMFTPRQFLDICTNRLTDYFNQVRAADRSAMATKKD